jgi:hypothetical protein
MFVLKKPCASSNIPIFRKFSDLPKNNYLTRIRKFNHPNIVIIVPVFTSCILDPMTLEFLTHLTAYSFLSATISVISFNHVGDSLNCEERTLTKNVSPTIIAVIGTYFLYSYMMTIMMICIVCSVAISG